MTTVFDQLHTDHVNVAKLLEHFENELEAFSISGSEPNYLKWQNILLYMTTYQDIFHHPTEEKLFAHLKNYDAEIGQSINEVESQHEKLYEKSRKLTELLAAVETDYIAMEKNELVSSCKDYINLLLEHMSLEERLIFPFAKENMAKEDWMTFEDDADPIDDPLFSAKRREEFAELYQCICAQ